MGWTLTQPNVYYMSVTELLLWMTNPAKDNIPKLLGQCHELGRKPACTRPNTCELQHQVDATTVETRYMPTCNDCPDKYPWI